MRPVTTMMPEQVGQRILELRAKREQQRQILAVVDAVETRPKDAPEVIAETLSLLKSRESIGLKWFTDMRQTITVKRPADDDGRVSLDVQTVTYSARTEYWPVEKIQRYMEAGFWVRMDGEAHKEIRRRENVGHEAFATSLSCAFGEYRLQSRLQEPSTDEGALGAVPKR